VVLWFKIKILKSEWNRVIYDKNNFIFIPIFVILYQLYISSTLYQFVRYWFICWPVLSHFMLEH